MNCALCQNYLDAWLAGTLSASLTIQVDSHLSHCPQCREVAELLKLSEAFIAGEKQTEPNPFLATRIMAAIEANEARVSQPVPAIIRLLRPAAITLSLAAAVFAGIFLGRLTTSTNLSGNIPAELVMINDAQMEAISLLSNE